MRILALPQGLRNSVLLLVATTPVLAAVEPLIASRAPWRALPTEILLTTAGIAGGLALFLAACFLRGHRQAFPLAWAALTLWIAQGAWDAIRLQLTGLGYFTVAAALVWVATLLWIRAELLRSYLEPGLRWYQGLPRAIPGLKCELVLGDKKESLKVCRMDRDGAFVFADGRRPGALENGDLLRHRGRPELVFSFRERQVRCQGVATRFLGRGFGAGVRFAGMSPDSQKEMGDFVEILRGEGYV